MQHSGIAHRPHLTLHVFGSSGCGKTTFKQQWNDSSHARPLSEMADVHIWIKRDTDLDSCELPTIEEDEQISHAFLVIYRPDSQGSRQYAQQCLQKIGSSYERQPLPVYVLENHFERTYKPPHSEPTQLPSTFLSDETLQRMSCNFWPVRFENGMDQRIMEHIIIGPIMKLLDEDVKSQLIVKACTVGYLPAVKLLAGRIEESNPVGWLACVMASLQRKVVGSPHIPELLLVAEYLYNLDPTLFLSTIVRMAKTYPHVSLDLINKFRPQGQSDDHFVKSGLALVSIPVPWIQNGNFTHIDLSNNLLLELPEALFQLSTLKGLNVSHNCLGAVPDILKWNCPYLRELNLSYNRLVDTPYRILNRPRNREDKGIPDAGVPQHSDQQGHYKEAQQVYNLTGYNLYPCIHSLNWVVLSNNASLSQVPEWVCILPHLTLLEIESLPKMNSLTPYLAHCRNLCILKVDTHRLVSPPASQIANGGTRAILAYLRCQLRGSTPYRHLKLVLIGANGTGKTTLFSQLVRFRSHPLTTPSPSSNTHMELATFDYRGDNKGSVRKGRDGGRGRREKGEAAKHRPKITFHLIDFTSEEVFQSVHQCFLTHRTLYLCLWDTTKGVESLHSLAPWLRSIQACAPGSSVLLIGSHIDQRPALSRTTISQWEKEVFGAAVCLGDKDVYPMMCGYPKVSDSVAMNCQNRRDVEKLMDNIYRLALQLKHPKTHTLMMEEMVPRSYQELQTLVEVKLRGFQRNGQLVPVLRHEEFVDHVRSLTLHHDNLEQDEEEFSLAVRFLHEAGTIVHYKSQVLGMSELYFLSPQWLFNTLGSVLSQLKLRSREALISGTDLPQVFQIAGIPAHYYNNILSMLEESNIIVSLDMEKNFFLIPSVLRSSAPSHYPAYDLADDEDSYLMQYVHLDYMPSGFFPRLLARVLICLRQLSGQLLSLGNSPLTDEGREGGSGLTTRLSSLFATIHNRFRLDQLGYVDEDYLAGGTTTEQGLRQKIWALSTNNLATWPYRHRSLTEKLVTLSRPILERTLRGATLRRRREGEGGEVLVNGEHEEEEEEEEEEGETFANEAERSGSKSPIDNFSENVVWKKGLYVEFPCGTQFWLESCEGALAIVVSGEVVPRVKVISFLMACVDMMIEECFAGLRVVYYSPCPSCLTRYWTEKRVDTLAATNLQLPPLAQSDLELSGEMPSLTLNEFRETASYSRCTNGENGSSITCSFSGSTLKLERSPSPTTGDHTFTAINAVGDVVDEIPCALLDESVTLYSLAALVVQSAKNNSIQCSKCEKSVSLRKIGPHVLFVDFSDKLLINSRRLLYGEAEGALLGEGGFGKVVKGTYEGHPVAVKLFRRAHRATSNSLAKQYKNLREEITVLSHLDYPRVVKLMGVCLRPLCMVMDLAPQGSLANHLNLCPLGLSHVMAHRALYQIADGIHYLHSLYIIHRDIKPGNILVWSLDPDRGVDLRLADYGVSQFTTPSGLWRHKGTEEYMAPELRGNDNLAYDEKVDIFSFGLLLHLVMTGRKLFAGIMNRREQLRMIYHADIPQLSQALAKSVEDNRPQSPNPSLQHILARDGKHPAARRNMDSSCHSVCMQPLMQDCLAQNPFRRPSARGICSRLFVCPGGLRQVRFFITSPVTWAAYSATANHVVAMQEGSDEVLLVIPGAWLYRTKALPYHGQKITCAALVGKEVFMGSSETNLVFSMKLPALTSGHISPVLLPGSPLCIIPQETAHGSKVIVGMSAARIAIFSPPGQGRHLLETHPFITQVLESTDPEKTAISCGVYYKNMVWCGCGKYLVGLDSREYMMKHYKPLLREATRITHIVSALGQLWVSFFGRPELVSVNAQTAHNVEPIDCHLILGMDCSSVEASITDLVSSGEAIWVGTQGGHVITFDPVSADVLLIHRRYCHTSALVCMGTEQMVVFGKERVEGMEGMEGEDEEKTVFTVWDSYVKHRVM